MELLYWNLVLAQVGTAVLYILIFLIRTPLNIQIHSFIRFQKKLDPLILVILNDSRALSTAPCSEIWTSSVPNQSPPPPQRHWRAMAEWMSQILVTTAAFEKTHLSSWWNQTYQVSKHLSPITLPFTHYFTPEVFSIRNLLQIMFKWFPRLLKSEIAFLQ